MAALARYVCGVRNDVIANDGARRQSRGVRFELELGDGLRTFFLLGHLDQSVATGNALANIMWVGTSSGGAIWTAWAATMRSTAMVV